ncbi:MAG: ATP-binding protein [Verrucomicrobiales bacterium]|nr:ATP-binding protein [Verrucomicrobiales bacterium]
MSSRSIPTHLSSCEEEEIARPDFVQPHGLLLVMSPDDLTIRRVSSNAEQFLDKAPEEVIGRRLSEFLEKENFEALTKLLNTDAPMYSNPLTIAVSREGLVEYYDGLAHQRDGFIILEIETREDGSVPDAASGRSIEHHFRLTSATLGAIRQASTLTEAAFITCQEMRQFTGYDRVMFYLFAEDGHGEVIAEDKRADLESFAGLHYPASDIPDVAKRLYVRNPVRLVHDVEAEPAQIVPHGESLDMTFCALRAVSPFHIQYLKNMGVASTMSVSLIEGDNLWGLLACHHYDGPHLVPCSSRVSCVHFGMVVSAQIRAMMEGIAARELAERKAKVSGEIEVLSVSLKLDETIKERPESLLSICEADGLAFLSNESLYLHGETPSDEEVRELWSEAFDSRNEENIVIYDSISESFPHFHPGGSDVAGALMIRCSTEWGFIFFRREHRSEVRWGGNPKGNVTQGSGLSPRNSFDEWVESVKGHSRPWSRVDSEIARELHGALMAFVMQQTVQLERLNEELTAKNREVQQFAYSVSHDLKSPLVTINGWVGALEEDLASGDEADIDQALSRIKNAVSRMGRLIEDLLAFSKIGRVRGTIESIDVDDLLNGLKAELQLRLESEGFSLTIDPDLPPIRGYPMEIRRAFENLISNALKYGSSEEDSRIHISGRKSAGGARYSVRDFGEGIHPDYQKRIFELFQRLDQSQSGTGVGLATVTKIVQLHRGHCGVESAPGEGAEFWIELKNLPLNLK